MPEAAKPGAKSKKESSSTPAEESSSVKPVEAAKKLVEKPKTNGTVAKDPTNSDKNEGELVSSSGTEEAMVTEPTDSKPAARGRKRKL